MNEEIGIEVGFWSIGIGQNVIEIERIEGIGDIEGKVVSNKKSEGEEKD